MKGVFLKTTVFVFLLFAVILFAVGCSPYSVRKFSEPNLEMPETFSFPSSDEEGQTFAKPWWKEFAEPGLHAVIERAMTQNLTLKAAWSRLLQAQEANVVVGSTLYPQLQLDSGISRERRYNKDAVNYDGIDSPRTLYSSSVFVRKGLSYEIDLWQRIVSQVKGQQKRVVASRADFEFTALLIAGNITDLWFQAEELKALLVLLNEQVVVGETLLELIELRLSFGQGSALDVLQQRQQVEATRSEIPVTQSRLARVLHGISVLIGSAPSSLDLGSLDSDSLDSDSLDSDIPNKLTAMPEFPALITPADLLHTRPELRAALARVQGAEFDVAAAFANRFPRLSLGFRYDFQSNDVSDMFASELGLLSANTLLPIVDGGKLRAEVRHQEAIVSELLDSYGGAYLMALRDVEDALSDEHYQLRLLERLKERVAIATATLDESKARYVNGLSDYVPVILAVQSLHSLERRMISEQRVLLTARTRLYRAIGGHWTRDLTVSGIANY